ncbi:metallophosphoesterase [Ferruginibacter sp.]|nr:metallophosphoesterase [Ferruginibacter sp.]
MKKIYQQVMFFLLIFLFTQSVKIAVAQTLTRGPYLQMGNQTGVTIRWRSSSATNSRVTWGTVFGTYPNTVDSATVTTEHIVRITGLSPDTKYYYTIGSTSATLQATNTNYVLTMPADNATRKLRFLALGDCGNSSTNQVDVKNAALSYLGANDLDGLLTIGDNAYNSGLDNEFQLEFFDIYKDDLFKNKKLYTAPGNHDYGNSSANTGVRNNAYYNSFSIPTAAECGGTASGTEAYYSYDIGNVHFVALDSYGREDANTTKMYDTSGAQSTWLKNDLAANTKKWTVVYFHHPPYTKTSHNSDYNGGSGELDLVAVRERFVRILERFGVDLILCGHSHGYERSYLLKNYYNTYASPLDETGFNIATHTATGNNQNAKYDATANSCPYAYNSGQFNHGSVYIVAGSAGQLGGSTPGYPHNAMYYSNITNGGSFYFEVDSNRLDAKFLSYSGTGAGVTPVIRDRFTIFKDVNKVTNITVPQNTALDITASWRGAYYWPNNGAATTQAVTINTATPGTFDFKVLDAASNNCLKDSFHIVINGVLPVLLSSFTATLSNDKVFLDWTTQTENNNKYFTIERSADGVNFNVSGKVNGAGNSANTNTYRLIDYAPLSGINYYRLSQTGNDGNITYHGIKKVTYGSNKNFAVSINSIVDGNVNLVINSNKNDYVKMKLTDIIGRIIFTESYLINSGANIKSVRLNSGVFVLQLVNSAGEKISSKIIVQ